MSALFDPRMAGCRRIFLHGFSLEVSIGFHDFEREAPQRVLIDVDLFVPVKLTHSDRDDVADVLDYDFIRQAITTLARSRHFNLQETLLEEIAQVCFSQPQVHAVLVSTQKPDVYPDCHTVGIEILRFREEGRA